MKKIIWDIIVPAIIIMIFVVGGIFIAQKFDILNFGQGSASEEVRTVDTPEYKALDSAYREQEKKVSFWQGYVEGLEMYYDKLEEQKQGVKSEGKKKEQEYQAKPDNEKETEFWKKYNEMWGK